MNQVKKKTGKRKSIYDRYRPNTAIWIGRLLPICTFICLFLVFVMRKHHVPFDWSKDILSLGGIEILLFIPTALVYIIALYGFLKSSVLKGGIFEFDGDYLLDEFERSLSGRSKLITFRILGFLLAVPLLPVFMDHHHTGGLNERLEGMLVFVFLLSALIIFTLPAAIYHWRLKLVLAEDNIRPDLPFTTDVSELAER